jgi:hypothetical protein
MPDRDIPEHDSRAFVVYVPPNNGNKTFESCLRLGAGPKSQSTQDETNTYNDAVAAAERLSGLSLETYQSSNGIALLTPGTINFIAADAVNTSCGNYTHSTIGDSYVVTQDPGGAIVSASYTRQVGLWATSTFNQATTVSVNTVPLQASIAFAPSYSLAGPLVLTNNAGLTWNNTIGYAVTAQLARTVNIGWRSVVSTKADGSNNAYFTVDQASSTGAGFKWTVPVATNYTDFDNMQKKFCAVVNVAAVVVDALALAYATAGLIEADNKSPAQVQAWLKAAEPVAILCTALDGILAVAGVVLGYIVDHKTDDNNADNIGATAIKVNDGSIELTTATPNPALNPAPDPSSPNVKLQKTAGGGSITLTTGQGASITLDGNSIKIEAATVTISSPNFSTIKGPPKPPPTPDPHLTTNPVYPPVMPTAFGLPPLSNP